MTVLEAIQKSAEFLAKKGVESPRLQTELLLAHLLKLPRMKLYLNFERVLTPAETDACANSSNAVASANRCNTSPARPRFAASKSP